MKKQPVLSQTPNAIRKREARAKATAAKNPQPVIAEQPAPPVVIPPPVVPVPVPPPVAPQADAPAAPAPAQEVAPQQVIAGLDTVNDFLVTTGETWNARFGKVVPVINVKDDSFPFNNFEYVTTPFPDSRFAILRRSDTKQEIGVPFDPKSYFVFTNAKQRAFIETLQEGAAKAGVALPIKTAGTLRDCAQRFVSFGIDGHDKLQAGGREIEAFLSLLTGLDKTTSFTLVNSTNTVCCKNTFKIAINETGAPLYAKVKMTRNAELRIDEVPKIFEAFITGNNALLAKLNHWHGIGINTTQAEQLFAAWLAKPNEPLSVRMANIIERLKELHVKGKGNKGETALDAFNAVTEYYTHESAGDTDSKTKQFESSEIGNGAESKASFFAYLAKSLADNATFTGVCKVGDSVLVAYNKARVEKAAAKA